MPASHAVSVLLNDDLVALNRVVGVVRRRNLPVEGLTLGPSGQPGVLRLAFSVQTDDANSMRMLRQLEKSHGVHGVEVVSVPNTSEVVL